MARGVGERWGSASVRTLVQVPVALLVLLLVVLATATVIGRVRVAAAQHTLPAQWLPAQQAVDRLATAYLDQETGQRGFVLTGETSFLRPYTAGAAEIGRQQAELGRMLAADAEGARRLAVVRDTGERWQTGVAAKQIAMRRATPAIPVTLQAAAQGKALFDTLRRDLADLALHVSDSTTRQLRLITSAQLAANIVTAVTVVLAFVITVVASPAMRRLVIEPLRRLGEQVGAVAAGAYDQRITPSGPAEIATLGADVERMRPASSAAPRS